jgi:cell shape-determining protein MreD
MNWPVFALFAYVAAALDLGLGSLPVVGEASFILILAVFVGLNAPGSVVAWALLILGLLVDLQPGPVHGAVLLGPGALGFLAGAYAVLQLRTLLFRESVMTLAVMVLAVGVFVQLVMVALLTMRGLPMIAEPIAGWNAADQLAHRFMQLLYTAALSVPVGWVLIRSRPLWGFAGKGRAERHF